MKMTYRRPWFWFLILVLLFIWAAVPQLAMAGVYAQPAEYSIDDLWSAAGVAALTALLLGGLVKPWVKRGMGEDHQFYVPVLNTVTFAIALGLATLGAVGLGLTYENVVNGLLVAIVGFTSAIGGYEVARGRTYAPRDGDA